MVLTVNLDYRILNVSLDRVKKILNIANKSRKRTNAYG